MILRKFLLFYFVILSSLLGLSELKFTFIEYFIRKGLFALSLLVLKYFNSFIFPNTLCCQVLFINKYKCIIMKLNNFQDLQRPQINFIISFIL